MLIEMSDNIVKNRLEIRIFIPRHWLQAQKRASARIDHLIDMPMFFGMLRDVVAMKLGIELPQTDRKGHDVAA